jgi:hypothetical protein
MDSRTYLDAAAVAIIALAIAGPVIRRLLHARFARAGKYKEGVATVVCKKCHVTTHRFHYPPDGGALCAKCSNWE